MAVNRIALGIAVVVGVVVHVLFTMGLRSMNSTATSDLDLSMFILLFGLALFAVYGLVYAWLARRIEHAESEYSYGAGVVGGLVALISWIVMAFLSRNEPSVQEFPGAFGISLILGGLVIITLGIAVGASGGSLFASLTRRQQAG
jgi:uncharacterized membrane protein YhdT